MRPVQFIYNAFVDMVNEGMKTGDIVERLRSDSFEKEFKETYTYANRNEEFHKMLYELEHYKKVLRDTPFRCVYGEDGSLQYYHMCQECGNILHDPHDEWYVTEHDMMCPTCNGIDVEKYPFKTIARGTMHWVHLVRGAAWNDTYNEENPEHAGYVSGSAKGLAFTVTRWMAFKWWLFIRWNKIKSIVHDILHPIKYIKAIKARNEWRKKMETV